jgi:hypothetical protein
MTSPERFYVYGLVAAGQRLDPAALGTGVGGAAVTLRGEGALQALVSPVDAGEVAQTRRNLLAHTALLERVMAQATVLPVRFGTVAPGEAALNACITTNQAAFSAAMAAIDGKVELGVKASWREGVVFAEIIASDASLARLRNRLRDRPASETYYERVELGRQIEQALAKRRTADAEAILAELAPLADGEAELKTLDDDMVLNRAFLVSRANEPQFDARMRSLSESREGRMVFRYVGPVPPYNFVQLRADWQMGAAQA